MNGSRPHSQIHLIGIGGSGMQGLARFLQEKGTIVSGSDLNPVNFPGVPCYSPHQVEQIEQLSPTQVVYSPAIPENNQELQWALRKKIPIRSYPEQVGEEMKEKFGIAVAGTHGKSTTSTLITHLLFKEGRDPSFIIGAKVAPFQTNGRYGKGAEMVVEACEYQKSFLALHYDIAVINNIEEDHLDCYADLAEIKQTFREFARKLKPAGLLVLPYDLKEDFENLPISSVTVGKNAKSTYQYHRVTTSTRGCRFWFRGPDQKNHKIFLPLFGKHNIANAAMALAVAHHLGIPMERASRHLESATTPARRFQIHQREPFVVIEDFAHHPTKIYRTLEACRQRFPHTKIHCVFQAHQHHRTRVFLDAFADVLTKADSCLIPPIFQARDSLWEQQQTKGEHLTQAIQKAGGNAQSFESWSKMKQHLLDVIQPEEVLLVLGAGDIGEFVPYFLHASIVNFK